MGSRDELATLAPPDSVVLGERTHTASAKVRPLRQMRTRAALREAARLESGRHVAHQYALLRVASRER